MAEPTLLLTPRLVEDTFRLQAAALKLGWHVERLENWRAPQRLATHDLVLYGEPLFAEVVAQTLGYMLLQTPYDWLASLPIQYLQREVRFTNLGEARRVTHSAFVKPVEGKSFVARVYASGKELPTHDFLPDTTPILSAEPVHWEIEFRCFVLDRQVVTLSSYLRAGELTEDANGHWIATPSELTAALTFSQTVLNETSIHMPAAFVLDVGLVKDRGWAVIESNAAWGAGLYGCDPTQVLRVLRRACVAKKRLKPVDEPWIIPFGEIIP